MLWFLRLIDHRILRDLSQAEADKAILQDRLERGDQERARLWELTASLQTKLDTSYRMNINREWQEIGAPAPYPDSPHLPKNMVHALDNSPMPARRSQGSQIVQARTLSFKKKFAQRMGIAAVSHDAAS